MYVKKQEFDSEIFGINIGQIFDFVNLDEFDFNSIQKNFDYVYIKLPVSKIEQIQFLEVVGFRTSEVAQKYTLFNKNPYRTTSGLLSVEFASITDLDRLYELASNLFYFDRYHLDYFLDKEKVKFIYQRWLENSILGKYGNGVIISRENKLITGFSSIRLSEDKIGHIDLTASINNAESLSNAISYLYSDIFICLNIETSTQVYNTASIHSLKRNGFIELGSPYITLSKGMQK